MKVKGEYINRSLEDTEALNASNENRKTIYDVVKRTSKKCFVPLTVGGGVRNSNRNTL